MPLDEGEPGPHVWPFGVSLDRIAEYLVGSLKWRKRGGRRAILTADGKAADTTDRSPALQWAVRQYAELGYLPAFEKWPQDFLNEAIRSLSGVQFMWTETYGKGHVGLDINYVDVSGDDEVWLALGILAAHKVRIGICSDSECREFFVDLKHRGKSACCPEHANRVRQRNHFEKLKKNERKYLAYKEKQAAVMRDRRAKGLA